MFSNTSVPGGSWGSVEDNPGDLSYLVAEISLPLPENPRDWYFNESFNVAWPQILAFVAAIVSILSFILISKALTGRG